MSSGIVEIGFIMEDSTDESQRSTFRVALIVLIFVVISLLTNIIGPLIPEIIKSFRISLTMAAFLPFSFFVAYAIMSIPSGMIIEKKGEKPVLLGAFALALFGSLFFALFPRYWTALLSLFMIGLGMASLQVAINPLLRVSGGEEHYAFNGILAQLFFGLASFVSPLIYSYFVIRLGQSPGVRLDPLSRLLSSIVPPGLPWVSIYWIFTALTLLMLLVLSFIHFPRVERTDEEKTGALAAHVELLKRPVVVLFFLGIFAYVGLEQGISNWISQFLASYHGFNPRIEGAAAVSRFWGLMTVGAALGLILLKFFDCRKVLVGFSVATFVIVSLGIFGSRTLAFYVFPLAGFSLSVMWSIIFSLALNSLASHHGTFSGILCSGIVGGALVPLLIGTLGDHFGLRTGLCFLYLPLGYILSIGIWARPLIINKTIGSD